MKKKQKTNKTQRFEIGYNVVLCLTFTSHFYDDAKDPSSEAWILWKFRNIASKSLW